MTSSAASNSIRQDAPYLIAALLSAFILFFIDEGNYNLKWMKDWANWFFYLFYFGFFVLGQYLLYRFAFQKLDSKPRSVLTIILGLPLGFILALASIFALASMFSFIGEHTVGR